MDTIDYFTISSTGNAADFANLSVARRRHLSGMVTQQEVYAGGRVDPNMKNEIDFVTIATTGNATDFGDLLSASGYTAGCASPTRGISAGGVVNPGGGIQDVLSFIRNCFRRKCNRFW